MVRSIDDCSRYITNKYQELVDAPMAQFDLFDAYSLLRTRDYLFDCRRIAFRLLTDPY